METVMLQEEIDKLIALYTKAREHLLHVITTSSSVGMKTYSNQILNQLQAELSLLQQVSDRFIETQIPIAYRQALEDQYSYFQKTGLNMTRSYMFAQIHTDSVYMLAREMQFMIRDSLASVGRQVERYLDRSRDEALRQIGLRAAGEKIAAGEDVRYMQQAMSRMLTNEGFMTIQYGDAPGRQVRIDSYARLVARSTTREATNAAKLNTGEQFDMDLVRVSTHYPTCDVCAPIQGRIYSRTGKDTRFPELYSLPGFRDGYMNFHPNCRHVITVTVEALWTDEEREQYLASAGKPTSGDTRTEKEVALYGKQQGKMRRLRQDYYQFERYKMRLGQDAPKSFRAFRQIKKAGGNSWGILEAQYRGTGYYDKAVRLDP